ncbi:hypothetical protein LXL04_038343 [Taraxacum kok-saghyz]
MVDTNPYGGHKTHMVDITPIWWTQTHMVDTNPYGGLNTHMVDTNPYGGHKTHMVDITPIWWTQTHMVDTNPYGGHNTHMVDTNPYGGHNTHMVDITPIWWTQTHMVDITPIWWTQTHMVDMKPIWWTQTHMFKDLRCISKVKIHPASSIPYFFNRLEPEIAPTDFWIHSINKPGKNYRVLSLSCIVSRISSRGSRKVTGLNVKSGTRPVFSVKVLIVSNAVLNDEYAARVSATVPHSSSFRSPLLSVNSPLQISFTASVPQQDPQKMKMPLKQQQKQATEMPSPKIASNFPNPEIPKLYDPTQSHETTQPEREQKNFPRLPFGLQQQKVAMDPTQNSNRKTEMPSVDHSVQTFGFPPLEDREKSVSIKTILPLSRIGKFVKRESIKLQHEPNLQHEPFAQFTEEEKKRREIRAKIMLLNFKVLNPFIQRQLTVDVELSRRI